jgi:hypothetical protein
MAPSEVFFKKLLIEFLLKIVFLGINNKNNVVI